MKEIETGDLKIKSRRRTKDVVRLRLFDLKDGSGWLTHVGIVAGSRPGPIMTVVAGQHGDEWNGTYIAQRLYRKSYYQRLTGTLVIVPIANSFAYLQKSRVSVIDQVDMNRSYGIDYERYPTVQAANLLFEEIYRHSHYLVDIHTGGPGAYLANIGVAEQGRCSLAMNFNTGTITTCFKEPRTLVNACERNSIPAFSLQIGHALDIDYEGCEKALMGIKNFMRSINMIDEPSETIDEQELFIGKELVPVPESGFADARVGLGDEVEVGQILGQVETLFGDPVDVIAPQNGRVLYRRYEPVVCRGDSLIHIALRGKETRGLAEKFLG